MDQRQVPIPISQGFNVIDDNVYQIPIPAYGEQLLSHDIDFIQSEDDEQPEQPMVQNGAPNANVLLQNNQIIIPDETLANDDHNPAISTVAVPPELKIYGIVLIREIKNPLNQRLSRKDVAMAFNSIFKMMLQQISADSIALQLPVLDLETIFVEPILSSGTLKGSIIINADQQLFEIIMQTPYCRQKFYDRAKAIEREFAFNLYDLRKIKAKHDVLQTGKFNNEFVQVMTNKLGCGKRTTQIILAMHVRDGQIYAIKKVELGSTPSWDRIYRNQVRQIREIRAMLRLSHKNVLRLFSWWMEEEVVEEESYREGASRGRNQTYLYLQTEYLAYKDQTSDLLEFIHVNFESKRIPLALRRQKIYTIFNQVMDGIEYIHEQGFFHRDIKPENILVTENCWGQILIKICDFDFAKGFDDAQQSQCSGTPGYAGLKSKLGQTYDIKEEIQMLGMVLLDLCKLFPLTAARFSYHENGRKNQFPPMVSTLYPEELALFKAMTIDQKFDKIELLRCSEEWQMFKNVLKGKPTSEGS